MSLSSPLFYYTPSHTLTLQPTRPHTPLNPPTHFLHTLTQWFAFRDVYMGRVDKMEDFTGKMYREYQDQWTKYAEALEKGEEAVKVELEDLIASV